jgi:hypothetical protein
MNQISSKSVQKRRIHIERQTSILECKHWKRVIALYKMGNYDVLRKRKEWDIVIFWYMHGFKDALKVNGLDTAEFNKIIKQRNFKF